MPSWLPTLRRRERDQPAVRQLVDRGAFDEYPFIPGGGGFELVLQQTLLGNKEQIAPEYLAYVWQAYKADPIVFACIARRLALFSEGRFAYQRLRNGRPGDYFGTQALRLLERPWPGASARDLLAIAEVNVSVAGNFFATVRNNRIRIMRPDWTTLVLGSQQDPDVGPLDLEAEVIAYLYQQGGPSGGQEPILLLPEEVAHYKPLPDPEFPFVGMSWLTPVIQEVLADKQMTRHRKEFLEAGATPNLAVKLNLTKMAEFDAWVAKYREQREGFDRSVNRYRTLFLGAAADPVPIGTDFRQLDFSQVQGGGEVRIAAAAGVHPAVLAISAGLQGSSLNAGNLGEAFRQFADGTIRPLWSSIAGAMQVLVPLLEDARLAIDDRDVPALQEDARRLAQIQQTNAATMNTLVTAGFVPESIVAAVMANDWSLLEHSGLYSVQLQKPGAEQPPPPADSTDEAAARRNGSGQAEAVPAP